MILQVHVEHIMTPRRLLQHALTEDDADAIARNGSFDAVPLAGGVDGCVRHFWSQHEQRRIRISRNHRVQHDAPLRGLLPVLELHTIQFVYYRDEMIGLVDASDLNKPLARLAWFQSMLELERTILDTVRSLKITEDEQAAALGSEAREARRRQSKAARSNLALPLLDYVEFPILLRASNALRITDISDGEIAALNDVRKRAAHAGDAVVDDRNHCSRLANAVDLALRVSKVATPSATRRRRTSAASAGSNAPGA